MELLSNLKIADIKLERPAVYVVATPIGNKADITIRALQVLEGADIVICEERKVGSRLLKQYEIKHDLWELNEHTEKEISNELSMKILTENLTAALISDAGTPLFADPGNTFIPFCYEKGIRIIPVPGASSIMAALMAAGQKSRKFLYYGFLPANRQNRQSAIRRLPDGYDIIILETPYRLQQLLRDLRKILGKNRQAALCRRLTCTDEKILKGDLDFLTQETSEFGKGEFVLILRSKKRN